MNSKKVRLYYLTLAIGLSAITLVYLLVPVYPAYTLPATPDLFGIAVVSSLLATAWKIGKPLTLPLVVRRSEVVIWGLIWFNLLVLIVPRAILSLFRTPGQKWIPCKIIPGFAPKLECLLQAAPNHHYGLRNLFIFFAGVTLATLVFLLSRTVRNAWKFLFCSIVFGAIVVTSTGFLGAILGIEQFLPKSLVNNPYGIYKMTQIFDNPGPVWTYLATGLAISLWWTLSTADRYRQILGALLSCFLTLGILATGQRGGLILCIVSISFCSVCTLIKGWRRKNKPILFLAAIIVTGICSGTYELVRNSQSISQSTQSIGYSLKSVPLFIDEARFALWIAAWNILKESPLLGKGYASWTQVNAEAAKVNSSISAFHSAHNWFIQLPVELGSFHAIFIIVIILLIFFNALRNQVENNPNILVSLSFLASFIPSFLGNLDDIRPVFYSHIILWSTMIGRIKQETTIPESSSQSFFNINKTKNFILNFLMSKGILIIVSISILALWFCIINFTWGGSAFEANLAQPSQAVFRWLGQSANIATFRTAENRAYSISELQPFEKPIAARFKEIQIEAKPDESLSFALENGSRYWPERHPLSFSKGMPDTARWISAGINYPFVQSNLAVSWSKNLFWWENFGGTLGRWCGKDCWFLAKSCGQRERLDFSLFAPRTDLAAGAPLSVEVAAYSLPKGGTFSSQTLANLPQPLSEQQVQLRTPEERLTVGVAGTTETAWYLVRVGVNSTLNPKTRGLSEDNRDLGVVVGEPDCSKR